MNGEVYVYASHTVRNPSSAINDYSFNITDDVMGVHIPHPGNHTSRVRRANEDVTVYITVIGGGSNESVNQYNIELTLGDQSNSSQAPPPAVTVQQTVQAVTAQPSVTNISTSQTPAIQIETVSPLDPESNNTLYIVLPIIGVIIVVVIALAVMTGGILCQKYGKSSK